MVQGSNPQQKGGCTLWIDEIFNITNSTNLDCQIWFQQGMINFDYSNFNINNYSFFSLYEIVVGKNVNPFCTRINLATIREQYFQILHYLGYQAVSQWIIKLLALNFHPFLFIYFASKKFKKKKKKIPVMWSKNAENEKLKKTENSRSKFNKIFFCFAINLKFGYVTSNYTLNHLWKFEIKGSIQSKDMTFFVASLNLIEKIIRIYKQSPSQYIITKQIVHESN